MKSSFPEGLGGVLAEWAVEGEIIPLVPPALNCLGSSEKHFMLMENLAHITKRCERKLRRVNGSAKWISEEKWVE